MRTRRAWGRALPSRSPVPVRWPKADRGLLVSEGAMPSPHMEPGPAPWPSLTGGGSRKAAPDHSRHSPKEMEGKCKHCTSVFRKTRAALRADI